MFNKNNYEREDQIKIIIRIVIFLILAAIAAFFIGKFLVNKGKDLKVSMESRAVEESIKKESESVEESIRQESLAAESEEESIEESSYQAALAEQSNAAAEEASKEAASKAAAEAAQSEDNDYTSHTYTLVKDSLSWYEAYNEAQSSNTHLVTFESEDEYEYVCELINKDTKGCTGIWIGANDNAGKDFSWVPKGELTFTAWASGQPQLYDDYDYVMMVQEDGEWKWRTSTIDMVSGYTTGYIIEQE